MWLALQLQDKRQGGDLGGCYTTHERAEEDIGG